jgi:hypothetical protein
MSFHRNEATDPIFHSVILFIVGGSADNADRLAQEWFKSKEVESLTEYDHKGAGGLTFYGSERHYAVWREDITDLPIMAHELSHVAIALFEDVRIPINKATDEVFGHYMEWLAKNCPAHLPIMPS